MLTKCERKLTVIIWYEWNDGNNNRITTAVYTFVGVWKCLPVGKRKIRDPVLIILILVIASIRYSPNRWHILSTAIRQIPSISVIFIEGIRFILFICSFRSPLELRARSLGSVCVWCMCVCADACICGGCQLYFVAHTHT